MNFDSENLPEGWTETTLNTLIEPLRTGSRPHGGVRNITEGIPSVGGEHLESNGGFRFDNIKYVPTAFYEKMNRGHIRSHDILVVKDGATTGKVSLVREDFPFQPAVVNEHVCLCRPLQRLYSPYLFYYLFSEEGQKRILENFQGSAQGGINQQFAPNVVVPIAPIGEQKRIVTQVEALLTQVNASRERLARVPAILKRFRQSVLAATYSGRLTAEWREAQTDLEPASVLLERIRKERKANLGSRYKEPVAPDMSELPEIPEGWEWVQLRSVSDIKGGVTKGERRREGLITLPTPYLRVANVQRGFLDLSEIKTIEATTKEIEELRLLAGDILFNEGGDRDKLGRGWVWENQISDCIHQNHVFRARLLDARIQPKFISWYGNSTGSQYFVDQGKQTVNLASLSITKLGELPVPMPPTLEQAEIVRRVETLFALSDAIEKRVEAARIRAESLTQSILARAFRGELVPTEAELARLEGREYETAEMLLERIQKMPTQEKQPSKRRSE